MIMLKINFKLLTHRVQIQIGPFRMGRDSCLSRCVHFFVNCVKSVCCHGCCCFCYSDYSAHIGFLIIHNVFKFYNIFSQADPVRYVSYYEIYMQNHAVTPLITLRSPAVCIYLDNHYHSRRQNQFLIVHKRITLTITAYAATLY